MGRSREAVDPLEGILCQLENLLDWGKGPYPTVDYRYGTAPTEHDYGKMQAATKEEVQSAMRKAQRSGKGRMAYGYDVGFLDSGKYYVRRFKVVVLPYEWYAEIRHSEKSSEEILRDDLKAAARRMRELFPNQGMRLMVSVVLSLQKYEKTLLIQESNSWTPRDYWDLMTPPLGASEVVDRWVANESGLKGKHWLVDLCLVYSLPEEKSSALQWKKIQPPHAVEARLVAKATPISGLEEMYWTLTLGQDA